MAEKILLDECFVTCFAPVHIIQAFLGSSRNNLKKNFVSSTTPEQKLYTFIWIICFTFSFCSFELHFYKQYYEKDIILYVARAIGALVQYLSYLTNIIHIRFCKTAFSTRLYLTIRKIDTLLPLKEYKNLKVNHFYWNIFFLILIIGTFECGFIYYVLMAVEYPILTIFWAMGLLVTYIEIFLIGSLIYYVTIRLRYLNQIIKYNLSLKNHESYKGTPSPATIGNQDVIISADDTGNLNLDNFISSLREILMSYKMITEVFSFTVFNIVATMFIWALILIEAMAEALCGEFGSELDVMVTSIWIVYYFTLITALAYTSDVFIQEAKQTKLLCIYVMSYSFEGPIRKGAKDIFRTLEFMQPVFSVYGIFILNKSLPLKLIGIITTNVVVLIQFTL